MPLKNKTINIVVVFFLCICQISLADETLFLELVVNEQSTNQIAEVVHRGDDWEIAYEDLKPLNLRIDAVPGARMLLNRMPGVSIIYDVQLQQLWLTIPNNMLPLQRLRTRVDAPATADAHRDTGLFVNYDVFAVLGEQDQTRRSSLWHGANYFTNDFYIVSNGILQKDGETSTGYTRFDSYVQYDNEAKLWSLALGDVINASPNWGKSMRMGGVRIARDYDLDPSLITYPLPEFYGESTVPSSVDLLINDQLRWREKVGSGPFLIDALPYISGAGIAQIVTTNAQGQQQQSSVNFYVTSQLLTKGMFDYDFTSGFRRRYFGYYSDSYAHTPSVSYSLRYGWQPYLTPQILLQAGEGLSLAGAGVTFLAGSFGVVEVTQTFSDFADDTGHQASIAYNYNYKNLGVNARYLQHFDGFRDFGLVDGAAFNDTETQLSASFHQKMIGTVNVGYFYLENNKAEGIGLFNFSWNRYFNSGIAAFLNINRQVSTNENIVSLSVSVPLGAKGEASVATHRDRRGDWSQQMQLMRNSPYAGGFGWNVGADTSDQQNRYAIGDWRGRYFEGSVGYYDNSNRTQYTGDISGAIIAMDGDIYASHFVNDAFALVDSERPNIPVLSANQLVGYTDSNGKLLVADLYSYLENHLSIDAAQLPANVSVKAIEQTVVPRRKGGVHVEFPLSYMQSALAVVQTVNQEAIPPGSILLDKNTDTTYLMGWDGEIYIESLGAPLHLHWREGKCEVTILPSSDFTIALPRLGPFMCKPYSEAAE